VARTRQTSTYVRHAPDVRVERDIKHTNTPKGYAVEMPGYKSHKAQVQGRLRRIEGQIRGVQKMVDDDRYCIDVLTQVSAVKAALDAVALLLLQDHTEHCVVEAIQAGDGSQKVRELNDAVERLVKGR
jgi:CsoR family transcriptional regulator, copper-sensing transcriptional repressor